FSWDFADEAAASGAGPLAGWRPRAGRRALTARAGSREARIPGPERATVQHDHERAPGPATTRVRRRPVARAVAEGSLVPCFRGRRGGASASRTSHGLGTGVAPHRLDARGGTAASWHGARDAGGG